MYGATKNSLYFCTAVCFGCVVLLKRNSHISPAERNRAGAIIRARSKKATAAGRIIDPARIGGAGPGGLCKRCIEIASAQGFSSSLKHFELRGFFSTTLQASWYFPRCLESLCIGWHRHVGCYAKKKNTEKLKFNDFLRFMNPLRFFNPWRYVNLSRCRNLPKYMNLSRFTNISRFFEDS